ncbi:hypothetical protein MXD63_11080 [Frankia sp. Cpl3]|nr:hypothetical protein [Frankia sp. Cpl3]
MHNVRGFVDLSRGSAEERRERRDDIGRKLVWKPGGRTLKEVVPNQNGVVKICVVDIAEGVAASSRSGGTGPGVQAEGLEGSGPDVDQVEAMADLLARDVWLTVRDDLDEVARRSGLDPEQVRIGLANHGWCDLIVGIVRVMEVANGVMGRVENRARSAIVWAITQSSMQSGRQQVVEQVVEFLVDKVWSALIEALKRAASPLDALTNEDLLRLLRIIAVFICPAPARHFEVRRYALEPLGEDARGYLTDQTKEYLGQVFVDWTTRKA